MTCGKLVNLQYSSHRLQYQSYSDVVLGRLKLPESNVDGDTTLTLSLQLVENPRILEGTLSELSSFLLELLNGTLVNTTALVDQVWREREVSMKYC